MDSFGGWNWKPRRRRLLWLLLVGVLLTAGALAYIEFNFHLPAGAGPAGPPVPLEPFEQVWTDRKVLLLGVGDSVTAGFGATVGHSYFDRLVNNPDDEFDDMRGRCLKRVLPNLTAQNLAVSGSNSQQHLECVTEKLKKQPDDVFGLVVMTSGGNDLIHWYGRTVPREGAMYGATLEQAQPWIANYERRLDAIFTCLQTYFAGGCLIYIADIYDPSDGQGHPETVGLPRWHDLLAIHAGYIEAIHRAAAAHRCVRVVPMRDAFLGHGVHCRKFWNAHYRADDPHYWYGVNLEDPHNRGYDAIRRVFLLEILKEAAALKAPRS